MNGSGIPRELLRREAYAEKESLQIAQLQNDSYMKAAQTARAERSRDRLTPLYHYTNAAGFMNDPNGFYYWRGRWHLFYQQLCDRVMVWGHAVSRDLVHWTELPYAITPDPDAAEESCWSGSGCCIGNERAIAAYFGYRGHEGLYVRQARDDLLLNWERCGEGPAVPQDTTAPEWQRIPYAAYPEVYDGTVFYLDGTYYMLSAGVERRADGSFVRQLSLYSSADLETWHYEHPFLQNDAFGSVGDDCACPFIVPFGTAPNGYAVIFFSHRNGPEYLTGTLCRETMTFSVTGSERFDHVAWFGGYAAPAAAPAPEHDGTARVVYIMHGNGLASCMSLVHRILPAGGGLIRTEPPREVEQLRTNARCVAAFSVKQGEEIVVPEARGTAVEIDLSLRFAVGATPSLHLFRSENGAEYTALTFYDQRGEQFRDADDWHRVTVMACDCSRSSSVPRWLPTPECVSVPKEPEAPLRLRIFLDRSVLEVFTETGKSLGKRILPAEGAETFSVIALSADVTVEEMTVYDMKPATPASADLAGI